MVRRELSPGSRKLLNSFALFATLLVFGTAGFFVVDHLDDTPEQRSLFGALYFTLIVLTTVGMEGPTSDLERKFAAVLMLVGIFLVAAAASNLVAYAIDGELNQHLQKRRLRKMIRNMDRHFIVVGYGRMGRALCNQLRDAGRDHVLIERKASLAEHARQHGIAVIEGDGTDEETLAEAGIATAAGLASCLPSDPANVFVTLTVRGLRPDMTIVARAEDPATEPKLARAGATSVICPPVVGATRLRETLIQPGVIDLLPAEHADADEIDVCNAAVARLPGLIGQSLADARITDRTELIVAAIDRAGRKTFQPDPSTVLEADDHLIAIGPEGGIERLREAFG